MQIGTPPRVSGDPFASMFTADFLNPPPQTPAPMGSLAHDLFGGASAANLPAPASDSTLPGGHGIGGLVNGLFETLFGGGGGGSGSGGVSAFGDFDPFQYVESTLAQHRSSGGGGAGGGGNLGETLGSLAQLVGL